LKNLLEELKSAQYSLKILENEMEDIFLGRNFKIVLFVLNDKNINNELKELFQRTSELRIIRLEKNQLQNLRELV